MAKQNKKPNKKKRVCGSTETTSGNPCQQTPKGKDKYCFRHKKKSKRAEKSKEKAKKGDPTFLQKIEPGTKEWHDQEEALREAFIVAFELNYGNITMTCNAIGIDRSTYYDWRDSLKPIDVEFMRRLKLIKPGEKLRDIAEGRMISDILDVNNPQGSTMAWNLLKTKGRDRGYSEKVIIEQSETDLETELIKNKIRERAETKGVTYEQELKHFLELRGDVVVPEIRENLVSDMEN